MVMDVSDWRLWIMLVCSLLAAPHARPTTPLSPLQQRNRAKSKHRIRHTDACHQGPRLGR